MKKPLCGLGAAVLTVALSTGPAIAQEAQLPPVMVWSAYDLGSSGYTEASSIANALQEKFETRVRIVPSGTSIGRLLPMLTGKVDYGFLANETFFASEGLFDFANQSWGPQDIRVLLGRPATVGIAIAGDVGAKSVADLAGKRVGFVKGNPSINIKTDAYLAFGGLSRDDVEVVWFGSYGAMNDAMLTNQIDAMGMTPTSSFARQLEASPRGLFWPSFDPENKKGWAAATKVISFAEPAMQTTGVGISEEQPVWMLGYRYPMIVTYAEHDADEVYSLVKAIDESFDLFKDAVAGLQHWQVSHSILPPADAPMHEGAIRYAKEKGYWSDRAQQWQDARLKRFEAVSQAWDQALQEFSQLRARKAAAGEKIDAEEQWPIFWTDYRRSQGLD